MYDVLRFWLDRGVDGFRVDVIYHIVKDDQFRDNPRNPDYKPGQNPTHEFLATYIADRPEVHDIISEMRHVLDQYPDRMLVGEVYLPIERLVTYYGKGDANGGDGVHMPFNFQLVTLPWKASAISAAIQSYEKALPSYGWPNWVLGNHDNPRIASRAGREQTRVAAMMLLTLRGTPTLYYGDEIGMADVAIAPHQVQDPFEKNVPGMGLGRDPERTPMPWDASPNCGFSSGEPWLPLGDDCGHINVAVEQNDPRSLLSLYRKLIELRRAEPALHHGRYESIASTDRTIVYLRSAGGRCFLVALNLSDEPQRIEPTNRIREPAYGRLVLSTHLDRENERIAGTFSLRANEGIVVEWNDPK